MSEINLGQAPSRYIPVSRFHRSGRWFFPKLGLLLVIILFLLYQRAFAQEIISKRDWKLVYVNSQETYAENGRAPNAFDNNPSTIWVTKWYPTSAPLPHEIQIDLGGVYELYGFRYLPRQDGGVNGRIGQFEFYVSDDGEHWAVPVATGTFANDASEKQVPFTPIFGRYIRL